jgi:hypothetical protein
MMRAIALGAAMMSLAACYDVFAPEATGVYTLTTANDREVPAVVFSRSGTGAFDVSLVGGTLRLRHDDTFSLQLDYVEHDAGSDTFYSQSFSGDWYQDVDFVRLQYVDPDTGDWHSLGGFQRYRGVEVTLPVSNYGVNVRTLFER